MMNRSNVFWLAGLLLVGLFALPLRAQDARTEIRTMLEQRDREIKRLLGDKATLTAAQREQLKTMINDVIDFEAMGRGALGTHWSGLTAAQRTSFVDVFSDIVRAQSLSNLDIYRARVTYDQITVDGQAARVTTTTVYKDTPTKVEYLLARSGDGWSVQDIVLDGVSTVDGYARSFQSVVRKKGFDALMTSLRARQAKIAAQ